eukprot:GHVS01046691.1.p1 GENE.GHVS01046691.1~~GHVS01046691.1.p1  ORF type:complete len:243 (-),score=30.80 GHVS01046691.1:622-1350(-)
MTEVFHPRLEKDYDGRERGKLWGYIPSQEDRLKLDERRAGYTLLELHSYKLLMQTPKLPAGMPPVSTDTKRRDNLSADQQSATASLGSIGEGTLSSDVSSGSTDGGGGGGWNRGGTRMSSCEKQFDDLDLCVERGVNKAKLRTTNLNSRLMGCKGQWTLFRRCTMYRDAHVMKAILSWENKHVKQLSDDERTNYIDQLQARIRYLEYLSLRTGDKLDQIEYDREQKDTEKRLSSMRSSLASL